MALTCAKFQTNSNRSFSTDVQIYRIDFMEKMKNLIQINILIKRQISMS